MATQAETAANFGYSLAFFNSNAELKSLLNQATTGEWTPARFVAALQNTKWFRTTSESYRKYTALKSTDPATYAAQHNAAAAKVLNFGQQLGAAFSPKQGFDISDLAMKMGWTDDQLRRYVVANLTMDKSGHFARGQASALEREYRANLEDYGVDVSDSVVTRYVKDGLLAGGDTGEWKAYVQGLAASKYVALADRIKGGETVRQIADPYIQTYGKLLETDAENIGIDDPLIQRALQAKDKAGKPTTQTLYDFEDTLRKDVRWARTDNARDVMSSTANAVLKTFGLVG